MKGSIIYDLLVGILALSVQGLLTWILIELGIYLQEKWNEKDS